MWDPAETCRFELLVHGKTPAAIVPQKNTRTKPQYITTTPTSFQCPYIQSLSQCALSRKQPHLPNHLLNDKRPFIYLENNNQCTKRCGEMLKLMSPSFLRFCSEIEIIICELHVWSSMWDPGKTRQFELLAHGQTPATIGPQKIPE